MANYAEIRASVQKKYGDTVEIERADMRSGLSSDVIDVLADCEYFKAVIKETRAMVNDLRSAAKRETRFKVASAKNLLADALELRILEFEGKLRECAPIEKHEVACACFEQSVKNLTEGLV